MRVAERPSVFDFLAYRRFLEAWFQWKKSENPRFSHRLFQRRAKVSSAGLLANVIAGRRNLTPQHVEAFADALDLDGEERVFFAALVDLDQGEDAEARNDAMARVWSVRRYREAHRLEGASFRYLSDWRFPAVRELAACHDFEPEPAWVAARLGIEVDEAEDALATLRDLGLLVPEGETLVPADQRLHTAEEVFALAAYNYHRGMLSQIAAALDEAPPGQRHLLGATVPVPASLIPQLKDELNAMLRRILDLVDGAEHPDRVMQVGLQLVPLTIDPEEP